MTVRIIKKSWWIDVRFNHTRYRKRSPQNSKAGAQAYEALLRHKLARGEDIEGSAEKTPKEQSFQQFAGKWFEEYVVPNNKYSERKAKRHILSSSLVPFFGKIPVGKITVQTVEQYKAQQIKTGASNKTINNRLAVLNKCLVTATDWLNLEGMPPKIKKLKCPPAKTDYLSLQEAELLLSTTHGTFHEMLLTTLRTGMRQGEVKGLQWEAINWENNTVTVSHSWNDEMRVLEAPKSNRERMIPLDLEVYEILSKRKARTGFVFLDANGKPFSEQRLNARLAIVCAKAKLRRITWHVLRHTFATHLTMKGVAPNVVQVLLGHATIATTMRYAHVPSSSLREAIGVLTPKVIAFEEFGQPVGNPQNPVSRIKIPVERLYSEKL